MIETSGARHVASGAGQPVVMLVGRAAQQAWDAVAGDGVACDTVAQGDIALAAALVTARMPDVSAAIDWIHREQIEPALLVIGQTWPGEIGQPELMRLRQAAPLARICGLFASWCEGETRSGQPWPGAWRVFGHQWPQRGARQLAALAAQTPSVWNLPVTATAEEQLLAEIDLMARHIAEQPHRFDRRAVIAVVAAAVETGSALADACRALGYRSVVWREPPASGDYAAAAVLWDTTADRAARADVVGKLERAAAGAPIVAFLGFPRPEQIERARAAGVAAVMSKPLLLADLDWQLTTLLGRLRPVG